MTAHNRRSSREEQYTFDPTIFTPSMEERVRLPEDEDVVFQETQPFDQIWLWALMGFELIVILIPLILTHQPFWTLILAVGAMVLTMTLLSSLKLNTRIDSLGVHFRMKPFHFKERMIPWREIDQIYVRKYSPILEYGGWGVRYGRKGKAYNVKGNFGIQLDLKSGKKLLLGTQRPDEASRHLSQHPLLV